MPVRFIIGPAGSGKTGRCLELLRSLERQGRPGVFLVPEQSTYSADRELLEASDLEGLRHVRVLSFSRLAIWLRELTGTSTPPVLPEAVRPMLLRRVLAGLSNDQLGPLAPMKDEQGLLEELGRTISEIRAHGSQDFLESVRRACLADSSPPVGAEGTEAAWPAGSRSKIGALAAVFEAYDTALRDLGRLDSEESLAGCEPLIAGLRARLGTVSFFVDGFLSFTRREKELLFALARTGAPCEITFCSDEEPGRIPFLPIRRSQEALREGMERAGIVLEPPLALPPRMIRPDRQDRPGKAGRPERADPPPSIDPDLALLERRLYSGHEARPEEARPNGGTGENPPQDGREDGTGALVLQPARTPRQEVLLWARQIDQWIRLQAKPVRPSQIAVILRSVDEYRDHIQQIFPRYGIPYFLDERRSVLAHPRVRLILEGLEVLLTGWKRSAVIGFLRNPLLGAPPAGIDLLENLSLEFGYDFESWFAPAWKEARSPVRARPRRRSDADESDGEFEADFEEEGAEAFLEEEDEDPIPGDRPSDGRMDVVNPLRLRLLGPLREMEKAWQRGRPEVRGSQEPHPAGESAVLTGAEAVNALERMLTAYAVMAPGRQDPDPEWARRVDETLGELLSEARHLWGEIKVPLEEFARALRQGCRAARVGLTPRRLEQVVIGDVRRSRLSGIRCAVVGGLNEGLFPLTVADDLVLTEQDRSSLRRYDITLGPSAADRQEEEVYFFYIALTRASGMCLLTWSQMDDRGTPRTPSLLLQELGRALPAARPRPIPEDPEHAPLAALQTPDELGQRLAVHLQEGGEIRAGSPGESAGALGAEPDTPAGVWDELLLATLYPPQPAGPPESAPSPGPPSPGEGGDETGEPDPAESLSAAHETLTRSLPAILYKTGANLPTELVGHFLQGDDFISSVSRLQQYATCPYQSFAQRVLGLEPRPRAEISPLETGKLAHAALERFFRSPPDPHPAVIARRLGAVFQELEGHPDYLAFQLDESGRQRWIDTRLSLERFLRVETKRLHGSAYRPEASEAGFSTTTGNPVPILLPEGRRLLLIGRIDRLDVRPGPEGIRALVVDYKRSQRSGLPKTLEEGKDLQLVAYLLYVRDVLHWIPTGGLYIPVLPAPKPMEQITPEERNPLGLRAHGLFLRAEREEMDQDTGILVRPRGQGGQALPDEQALNRLLDRGRSFLASFASTQLSGWIAPVPLEVRSGELPCANCAYQALCRFRAGRDPIRRRPGEGMLHEPPSLAGTRP